jgi:hypothetical protein
LLFHRSARLRASEPIEGIAHLKFTARSYSDMDDSVLGLMG